MQRTKQSEYSFDTLQYMYLADYTTFFHSLMPQVVTRVPIVRDDLSLRGPRTSVLCPTADTVWFWRTCRTSGLVGCSLDGDNMGCLSVQRRAPKPSLDVRPPAHPVRLCKWLSTHEEHDPVQACSWKQGRERRSRETRGMARVGGAFADALTNYCPIEVARRRTLRLALTSGHASPCLSGLRLTMTYARRGQSGPPPSHKSLTAVRIDPSTSLFWLPSPHHSSSSSSSSCHTIMPPSSRSSTGRFIRAGNLTRRTS